MGNKKRRRKKTRVLTFSKQSSNGWLLVQIFMDGAPCRRFFSFRRWFGGGRGRLLPRGWDQLTTSLHRWVLIKAEFSWWGQAQLPLFCRWALQGGAKVADIVITLMEKNEKCCYLLWLEAGFLGSEILILKIRHLNSIHIFFSLEALKVISTQSCMK